MKKVIIGLAALFFCGTVFSQIYTPINPTIYGQNFNRVKPFLVLHVPEKDGLVKNTDDTTAQIFYNRGDSSMYVWTQLLGFVKIGSDGGGGIDYSMKLDSIGRKSDLRVYQYKGSPSSNIEEFLFKDSVGITELGIGYGLVNTNDSTYQVDSTVFVNTTKMNNFLSLYLKSSDAALTYQPIGNYVTTMAAIGSSPNANGATISGSTLTLQPASASFGGLVTTGTQSFAGTKTFSGAGHTVSGAMNVSGSFRSTSVAITSLGITPPASQVTFVGVGGATAYSTIWTATNSGNGIAGIGVPVSGTDLILKVSPGWNNFGTGTEVMRWVTSTGNVLIGTSTDVTNSIFTVASTSKGSTPVPVMTTAQRNSISSPSSGLQSYDNTSQSGYWHNGSSWKSIPIYGSFSGAGTATTVFTVTFGGTQPNTSYKVNVTPTSLLSSQLFYVTNKTTTTFDVTYAVGLTGTVTFDWSIAQ